MSFDLFVYGDALSSSPRARVEQALREHLLQGGLDAQWHPGFDWTQPFAAADVPFKVRVRPETVPEARYYGDEPLLTCLSIGQRASDRFAVAKHAPWSHKLRLVTAPREYALRTSAGRTPLAFRLQTTLALALGAITRGVLLDPQSEQGYFAFRDGAHHLFMEARRYDVTAAHENPDWNLQRFDDWPALDAG